MALRTYEHIRYDQNNQYHYLPFQQFPVKEFFIQFYDPIENRYFSFDDNNNNIELKMKMDGQNVITYQESMYFSHVIPFEKKYTRNMNSLCISFLP